MEWLFAVTILVNLIGFAILGRKVKALPAVPQPKAISPAHEHKLVKTWIDTEGEEVLAGWRAKCSCGATSYATNAVARSTGKGAVYGSESNVIAAFENHAKNFNRANGNPYKEKLDALQKEFDEAQEKCYCKETHSVQLVPMKG